MTNAKKTFLELQNLSNRSLDNELDLKNVVNLLGLSAAGQELSVLRSVSAMSHSDVCEVFVVVLPHIRDFRHWQELLNSNLPNLEVLQLPHTTYWSGEKYSNQVHLQNKRLHCLSRLSLTTSFKVVLATVQGLQQTSIPLDALKAGGVLIKRGVELDPYELVESLKGLGYQESGVVTEQGYFNQRGGIIDLFSYSHHLPLRIEFFADEVESIRLFEPEAQLSNGQLDSIKISFAQECDLSKRKEVGQQLYDSLLKNEGMDRFERQGMVDSLLKGMKFPGINYFFPIMRKSKRENYSLCEQLGSTATICFIESEERTIDRLNSFLASMETSYQQDICDDKATVAVGSHFKEWGQLKEAVLRVQFGNPYIGGYKVGFVCHDLESADPLDLGGRISFVKKQLESLKSVYVTVHNSSQSERVKSVLFANEMESSWSGDKIVESVLQPNAGKITILNGYVSGVVECPLEGWVIVPEHSLFGEQKRKLTSKTSLKSVLNAFKDLEVGALVVHVEHGIGKYLGMETIALREFSNEFLVLEYGGGDKVYLPVDKLGQLQKYSAGDRTSLDRLKSQGWAKKKSRVRKAVKDIAEDLLKLHAKRQLAKGVAYSQPNDLYFQLEADFPYDETDDQLRCIDEVNMDLNSPRPMDRLICGDVGFGKTEVAIRAAMRVVMDGFQVLVLAPTTVLSFQHFQTFLKRFEKYGISTALLNRFIKSRDAKESVLKFNDGKLDILLGTHRVLSKDIKGKNIGLIIVDEEQRFGVTHKEKIKQLKASCDILTLTATPIPRSLHMSMLGLRDISTIMTAPTDRLEVKTYVVKWDESIIKASIEREFARGGQVFFVQIRVSDIEEVQSYLTDLIPSASIRIGHGQMRESELEGVIVDFIAQKFSILLCTTIIESGIDMPNVNTIIINNADKFGLSQMYQMRGRVGRSSRQSYAYFLTSSRGIISADAEKRLEVLSTHQELGAGFQIANYDLEIRGAGDLLGGAQSGHVGDVGIELYTQLLEEQIRKSKGEAVDEEVEPEIKVNIDASLPRTYIESESQRLSFYKRIFSSDSSEEVKKIYEEMVDRFGVAPDKAIRIVRVAELKLQLKSFRIKYIAEAGENRFEIRFASLDVGKIAAIEKASKSKSDIFHLLPDYSMIIDVSSIAGEYDSLIEALIYSLNVFSNYW